MSETNSTLDNLIRHISPDNLQNFLQRKNRQFKPVREDLTQHDTDRFSGFEQIGEVEFGEKQNWDRLIAVFVNVNGELTERACRKAQFEAARKILKAEQADAGLFAFADPQGRFRFSLIYTIYEDKKRQFNHFRRFTYFVLPDKQNNTFVQQLTKCTFDSIDSIQKHFSLEPVNKEFYSHIQKYFYELVGGKTERAEFDGSMTLPDTPIDAPENHKAYSEFAVRLLGRIVFCWFLKHKRCDQNRPLIPQKLLSSEAVKLNSGYYHQILEKLFFQTLNKPINERSEFAPDGAHLIPYLNGGLFDPHRDDFYEEGAMGESKYIGTLKVPDDWFLRLFQTLEQYNFTIDENTANDTDVSIDPEILGRIFENLLAEINPETGDSARKATGSFYTPREIVDYMAEESLLQHLKTALGDVDNDLEQKLRDLFVDDDQPSGLDKAIEKNVVDAFRTIKVLDPACGSGAFPVGILQKMLCALRKVDPENDYWRDAQVQHIHEMKLSKQEVDKRVEELVKAFETNTHDYGRKLGIIQNSVYGVDIQPIAIEISKLRFFLTLVVDEKIDEKANNRGILPLPNLDFKFVCANTLIPAPEMENTSGELDLEYYPDFFKDFTALTEQYFYAGTPREKQSIREQLSECVGKKIKGELDKVHELQGIDLFANAAKTKSEQKRIKERRAELVRNISLWESYNNIFTGQPVGFFDPKYMFPDAGSGFDVAIANPPYIDSEAMVKIYPGLRERLCEWYETTKGNWDIYIVFIEYGIKSLSANGTLAYITPDKWIAKPFGEAARKMTLPYLKILIEAGRDVFETVNVDAIISIFNKSGSQFVNVGKAKKKVISTRSSVDKTLAEEPWMLDFIFSDQIDLIQKLRLVGTHLLQEFAICENACATADAYKLKPLVLNLTESYSDQIYYKMINTGTIGKYLSRWGEKEMTYLKDKYLFPVVSRDEFHNVFPNAYGKKVGQPKLIIKGLTLMDVCLDETGTFIPGKTTLVISCEKQNSLFFLLGLLNSKLPIFYIKHRFASSSYNGGINFTKDMLNNFPVPVTTPQQQAEIKERVERILAAKRENPEADVSLLEAEIDQLVYKLYDLTPEEITIIEGATN